MQWSLFLKTNLKRINLFGLLLLLSASSFCFAEPALNHGTFWVEEAGTLFVSINPVLYKPDRIRAYMEEGRCCELYANFRLQIPSGREGFPSLEFRDVRLCRRAFLDPVSGNYVIEANGRMPEVYEEWLPFLENFSSPMQLSLQNSFEKGMRIWAKERLVYKKLFPPFSILYLIPGKYIFQTPWLELEQGAAA